MTSDFLSDRRNALESSFFARVDQKLLDELKERVATDDLRNSLALASGITSDRLLDGFVALGLTPTTLAAVSLVPLVEVAWADGKMSAAERSAILRSAQERGVSDDAKSLLQQWLDEPPPDELVAAWKGYIHGMGQALSPEDFAALRAEILGLAESVAEAAGGILGLGSRISADEKRKLAELSAAFSSGG